MTSRRLIAVTCVFCSIVTSAEAQQRPQAYAGALAGIATLSADAQSDITSSGSHVSLYKPENGPALNIFAGVHIHEYVALQANLIWNRNDIVLTSVRATDSDSPFYEQPRASSQRALVGDVLAYFRERRSALRPYLSVGVGVLRLETTADGDPHVSNATPPAATLHATRALLRVAVGIDVALGGGWSGRYSFSETLSGNPISAQLSPPGQRNLANFQNLFGIVRTF
jgi:hypothetical protein